jgi:hypothetical protein
MRQAAIGERPVSGRTFECGRLVRVRPPSATGQADPIVYVVAAEDPDEAMKLVADKVVIGSDLEVIGRASRQLLEALKLKPGEVVRA